MCQTESPYLKRCNPSSAAHRIHILLNAAGLQRRFPTESLTDEDYDAVLQTNLTGTFATCRAFGAYLIANEQRGVITNVASLAAMQGGVNMSAYAASKGGVCLLYTSPSPRD